MSNGKVWVETHWWGFDLHLDHEAVKYYIKGRELLGEVLKPFLPEGIKEVVEVAVMAQTKWIEAVAGDNGVKLSSPWVSPAMLIPTREDAPVQDVKLWWTTYAWDSDKSAWHWNKDQAFPGHESWDAPALAEYHGKLYAVHRGANDDSLWWAVYDPDKGWGEDNRFPGHHSAGGPALAVFQDKLYCVHRGAGDDQLWYTVFDGSSWSSDTKMPGFSRTGPALAVYRDRLYCVHRGAGDPQLWWMTFDGSSWSDDHKFPDWQATASEPGLAVYRDRLYCVHQGADTNTTLWWTRFDGSSWTKDEEIVTSSGKHRTSTGAALEVFQDKLYCAHRGAHTDTNMYWLTFDGSTWSPDQKFPSHQTASDPALIAYRDKHAPSDRKDQLLCVHRGHN
ncbi:hypothetical protein [Streptomyces bikiniensis]|uniref:hypothetical protein n=1 Tax=Streptomyces bikiniensis TaxID=1896 RepID=UPI00068A1B95|nr:hypothetical protein [Streptomyces bikiniensis]